ncbi:MAG TPA: class I SAM-dependent methyltransferase [Longimicrobium sp.]|nr:class I SAM-dependent methyltransferase [Longimicrobium sp.]
MFSETAELYDRLYSFKDYAAEAARVRELVVAAGGPGEGTLLDVACGTGKHAEALAAHYSVGGMDLDAGLLAAARARLPGVPLHQADMRDFDFGRSYGVVTCLFSSIGYAVTVEAMRSAVAAMARHLEPGAALVVEPWFQPHVFIPGYVHVLTHEEPGLNIVRMGVGEIVDRVSVLSFEYLIGRPDGITRASERHEMGLFTDDEMRAALEDAGLRVTHDAQGLSGRGLFIGIAPG